MDVPKAEFCTLHDVENAAWCQGAGLFEWELHQGAACAETLLPFLLRAPAVVPIHQPQQGFAILQNAVTQIALVGK